MKGEAITRMKWEEFTELFYEEYAPKVEMKRVMDAFMKLEQTTETVNQITAVFKEKLLYLHAYASDEGLQMHRYTQILREDIREFVATGQYSTIEQLIEGARKRELYLTERSMKRTAERAALGNNQGRQHVKKPNTGTKCVRCGKVHVGECRQGMDRCFRCGRNGHHGKTARPT